MEGGGAFSSIWKSIHVFRNLWCEVVTSKAPKSDPVSIVLPRSEGNVTMSRVSPEKSPPASPSPLFSLFSSQIKKLFENGRGKRLLLFRACCGASEGERSWSVGGGETCRWKNKTFLRISRKTVRGGNGEWEKGGGRESAGPGFRGGGLYGEARRNWSGGGAAVKEEEKLANERKARPLLNRMRKKEGLSCFSGSAPC